MWRQIRNQQSLRHDELHSWRCETGIIADKRPRSIIEERTKCFGDLFELLKLGELGADPENPKNLVPVLIDLLMYEHKELKAEVLLHASRTNCCLLA